MLSSRFFIDNFVIKGDFFVIKQTNLKTLQTAWVSWQGFQEASNMTTLLAPTRFTPRLPARVDTRNNLTESLALKLLIMRSLSVAPVLPSNRK